MKPVKLKYEHTLPAVLLMSLLVTGCANEEPMEEQTVDTVQGPVAERHDTTLSIHGHDRQDPYYWLRERENPKVVEYLNAENSYREEEMKHTEGLQATLYDEIIGRIKQVDESVPYKYNGYYYYTRYEEGKEYELYCRRESSMDSDEELMLDVNAEAAEHSYYSVGGTTVSPNNEILAFGEDIVSRRKYTIRFKNLKTGEYLEDRIPLTTGGVAWANDNKTVFYTVKDEVTLRSNKIFKHVLGTDPSEDVEVFHETDETFGTFVYKTKSSDYLIIGSYATLATEYRVLDANNPEGEFQVIQPRERGLEYSVSHFGDRFYIRTNLDAQNFRLMSCPVGATTKDNWTEEIAHRPDVLLEGIEIFKDYLVVEERAQGLTQLRVRPWNGEEHYIEFEEETYTCGTGTNLDFDTDVLRFSYTSLTTPYSTYDYNLGSKERELLKRQEVIGGYNPDDYQSERMYAEARDGTMVPISLVYKKGVEMDGKSPLLLYAYGSYGHSSDPYFSSTRLSLLDRGFIWAIAHVRGGEDLGRQWYEDGKLLNKKNTFFDFIDCGKHLVANNYTSEDNLFAMGGSAGGLLMGGIINYEPELFKGVIAAVPFVDVITTMLDESIPLTTGEYDEWGNPNDKEYYDYILGYSPYDNVEAKAYPAMLVTTGFHDSQVQYWEPAKWVARLRHLKTDSNPLYMYCNMETGHGGASGRFARYKETAMEYAFLLDQAGITE